MRHRVYGKKLGRDKNERTALFRSLVQNLLWEESIETTEAKARAIKGLVDKLITQAKSPVTRKLVSQFLTQKKISDRLFKELVPRMKDRNSGYTSTVKLGQRLGDGAMMVRMSLLLEDSSARISKTSKKETNKRVTRKRVTK